MRGSLWFLVRLWLRFSERAVDRPFTTEASNRIDVALVALEGR